MQSAEGGGEGEESGKEGTSSDPNYALSGKLTADTNTFRVSYIQSDLQGFIQRQNLGGGKSTTSEWAYNNSMLSLGGLWDMKFLDATR